MTGIEIALVALCFATGPAATVAVVWRSLRRAGDAPYHEDGLR